MMQEENHMSEQSGEIRAAVECRTCRYADPTVLHNVDGDGPAAVLLCRRYPPTSVYEADTEGIAPSWPLVHEQEWCGEWKEQP